MVQAQRTMTLPERFIARMFLTRPGRWFGLYILPRLDRPLLYLSRGRISMSPGQPILLLVTTGARSGKRHATPLLYFRRGDQLIVIASSGGQRRHPAWYYNLRANPQARVYVGGQVRTYVAYEAQDEERAELWRQATNYYEGFQFYERWVDRRIPVMVLVPRGE